MFLFWLRVAALLYAGASLAVFPAALYARARWRSWCIHLAGLGVFFHFVSVTEMLALAHRWRPVGSGEVESLLGLVVAALFFLLLCFDDAVAFGLFAFPASFFLVLAQAVGASGPIFPSAGVRFGWLMVHIVALLLAYASLLFSVLASVFYLVQESALKSRRNLAAEGARGLPPLETLERIAQATLEFGFPCMTVGLLIGALLAMETPLGAAYFTDAKILASFVCWFIYVLLLWLRRSAGLRGRRAAYLSGAVLLAMMLVWALNAFSQAHGFIRP